MVDFYKKTLISSKLLRELFSEPCLEELCLIVREQRFQPDEAIFNAGDLTSRLNFVLDGLVSVYCEKQVLRQLGSGCVIGGKNFLLNSPMGYLALAKKFTTVAYIEQAELLTVLERFPRDRERFFWMRDSLAFSGRGGTAVCDICGSSHSLKMCPFVFFQANRQKILTLQQKNILQERSLAIRKRDKFRESRLSVQQAVLAYGLGENLLQEEDINDDYVRKLGFSQADLCQLLMENLSSLTVDLQKELQSQFQMSPSSRKQGTQSIFLSEGRQDREDEVSSSSQLSKQPQGNSQISQMEMSPSSRIQQRVGRKSKRELSLGSTQQQKSLMKILDKLGSQTEHNQTNSRQQEQQTESNQEAFANQGKSVWSQTSLHQLAASYVMEEQIGFDLQKEYKVYFPEGNLSRVLLNLSNEYIKQIYIRSSTIKNQSILARKKYQFQSNLSNIMRRKSKSFRSKVSEQN